MNTVKLIGILENDFTYSHTSHGIHFYSTSMMVERTSGAVDYIPIVASANVARARSGDVVKIKGSFRSKNIHQGNDRKLKLYVKVNQLELVPDEPDENRISFDGTICKKHGIRQTPKGRIITDSIVAINHGEKSYYIPCVCWENNAELINNLPIGAKVNITGRIQSREYEKENRIRMAYEVSVDGINLAQN